jgi:hypothetical protein
MTYVGEVRSLWLVTANQPTGEFAASYAVGYAFFTGRLVEYSVQVVPAVAHVPLYTASVGTLDIRAKQRPTSFTLAECFMIDRIPTHLPTLLEQGTQRSLLVVRRVNRHAAHRRGWHAITNSDQV